MLSTRVLAVAGTLMFVGSAARADDAYRIIVNPANRISSVSPNQLSKFFLEAATWDDGQPVLPVDLSTDSPVRERFSKDVHQLPPSSVIERWRPVAAAGGKTPLMVATDADVIQYVRLKLGAIGYVSARADVSAVKVVPIERGADGHTAGAVDTVIQKALTAYTTALEARDFDALKRIWPGVTGAQERAIRAEFGHARTLRVNLLSPRIDARDDQAIVTARRRYAITTTEGTKLQTESAITLNLRRAISGWIIQDVRFRAEP
jgi:hypothetical protein